MHDRCGGAWGGRGCTTGAEMCGTWGCSDPNPVANEVPTQHTCRQCRGSWCSPCKAFQAAIAHTLAYTRACAHCCTRVVTMCRSSQACLLEDMPTPASTGTAHFVCTRVTCAHGRVDFPRACMRTTQCTRHAHLLKDRPTPARTLRRSSANTLRMSQGGSRGSAGGADSSCAAGPARRARSRVRINM